MASSNAIKAGEAFVQLSADDKQFRSALARAEHRLRELGNHLRQISAAAIGFGVAMTPVVAQFIKFDDAIRMVGAVSQATAGELDMLREKALLLGRTTSFTAVEVANLMGELGRAGFNPKQIDDMTAAVLDLARATGTDAAASAGFMAATIRQFNLQATDAVRVADGLTAAANKSFNSVTDLGEAMKYAGPVVADLGMSLEDTLAILGGLGNVGIRGSEAGTALRRISILASTGSKDLERLFGVKSTDAANNMRPLVDILDEIVMSTKDLGNAEKAAKFNEFFGLLGITGASAIGKSAVSIRGLREEILAAGGVASRTAKEMDAGLGGSWRMMKSAIEGVAIAIGEALAPALGTVGKLIEVFSNRLTDWVAENRKLAATIGGVAVGLMLVAAAGAGILAVGLAFKLMLVPVLAAVVAVKLLIALLAVVVSPIGVIVVSVGALVVVFLKATKAGQVMAAAIRRHMADVGKAFREIGEIFADAFGGIVAAVRKGELELAWGIALSGLKAAWLTFVLMLREKWHDFTNYFEDAFRAVALTVQKLGIAVATGLKLGFLGAVVAAIDAANKAHRAVLQILPGGLPEREAVRKKAEPELKPVEAAMEAEREFRKQGRHDAEVLRLRAKNRTDAGAEGFGDIGALAQEIRVAEGLSSAKAATEARRRITEQLDAANAKDAAAIAKLDQLIAESVARETILAEKWNTIWEKHEIGEKFIDPTPFREARKMIADEGNGILKEMEDLDRRERELRDGHQHWRLQAIRRERDAYLAEMHLLKARAELPDLIGEAVLGGIMDESTRRQLAALPMGVGEAVLGGVMNPGGNGGRTEALEKQLGQAARGLYQSADYRQSLGIGPPAQNIDSQQLGELKGIKKGMDDGNELMKEQTRVLEEIKETGFPLYMA